MFKRSRIDLLSSAFCALAAIIASFLFATQAVSQEKKDKIAEPITKGQRVFTCGHSFHVFVPGILTDIAKKAEIKDHVQVGLSSIGGSRVIQHWDIADEKNKAKEALKTGKVDVLTLSPIFLPDAGIENFARLALEYNKDIRIVVQPIWLRWDIYEPTTKRPDKVDHNAITIEELKKRHEPYFKSMDEQHPRFEQKARQNGFLRGPSPASGDRSAGKDRCRPGAGDQGTGGSFHRSVGAWQSPVAAFGRVLQLFGDLSPESGWIARSQCSETEQARR